MNQGQIKRIQKIMDTIKISPEEKTFLLEKLATATQEQLERLEDNLVRQLTSETYFEYLAKIEKEGTILTEESAAEMEKEIQQKVLTITNSVGAMIEIDRIQKELADINKQIPQT